MGNVREELGLHVVQCLQFLAHQVRRLHEFLQIARRGDFQRSTELPLADARDVVLEASQRLQNAVARDAGEEQAEEKGADHQLLSQDFSAD